MARKKKTEEDQEVKQEIKEKPEKPNKYGWHYVQNKAKFTNVK